jgi:hypothetical protein
MTLRKFLVIALASTALLLAGTSGLAASIPVWLDDAISAWNAENETTQIRFVDIKDGYVWYTIPKTEDIGHQRIRERVYTIAEQHGYQMTEREELVTTARPPWGDRKDKKCWNRGFTLDLDTGRQRMLTTLVCAAEAEWLAGFRILE